MITVGPEIGISKGYADGFLVNFAALDRVYVSPGYFEVDGAVFSLSFSKTHTMLSLGSAFDHHYIYLDWSASIGSPTSPDFYDETTEPVRNFDKNGWYHPTNVKDRLVGTVLSPDGSDVIRYFAAIQSSPRGVRNFGLRGNPDIALASALTPNGSWQTPNVLNGSAVTPISGKELRVHMISQDTGKACAVTVASAEKAAWTTLYWEAFSLLKGWDVAENTSPFFPLGYSRNIKVGGDPGDAAIYVLLEGYGYER